MPHRVGRQTKFVLTPVVCKSIQICAASCREFAFRSSAGKGPLFHLQKEAPRAAAFCLFWGASWFILGSVACLLCCEAFPPALVIGMGSSFHSFQPRRFMTHLLGWGARIANGARAPPRVGPKGFHYSLLCGRFHGE